MHTYNCMKMIFMCVPPESPQLVPWNAVLPSWLRHALLVFVEAVPPLAAAAVCAFFCNALTSSCSSILRALQVPLICYSLFWTVLPLASAVATLLLCTGMRLIGYRWQSMLLYDVGVRHYVNVPVLQLVVLWYCHHFHPTYVWLGALLYASLQARLV